jgi:predicted Zn finger-like uncharacterized protein
MFTVCPKCALRLVVTAADLRVAQGYVRCGRCSNVFNALAQLSEERQSLAATEPETPPAAPGTEPAPEAPADEEAIPEGALEFNPATTDAASVFVQPPPDPQWTAATGSFKELVAGQEPPAATSERVDVEIDASLLSDLVQGGQPAPASVPATPQPAPAASVSPAPGPAAGAAPASAPRRPGHPRPVSGAAAKPLAPPTRAAEPPRTPVPAVAQPRDQPLLPPEASVDSSTPRSAPARLTLAWTGGVVLLALLLAAQIVNHRRDALATNPRLNRPLAALYGALGVSLVPHWDLHAYDIRQLGAKVAPGSVSSITVGASVRNLGPRPQPLPLLRVTLQDRFGNRIASRDVQPREYLPASVPATSLLAPDQRIDAEMAFVDPGSNAVGFELDACLPVRGGVACANDATSR